MKLLFPHKAGLAALLAGAALAAPAQGIPVIDAANLVQTIQQVMNDITAINNQVQQITQLQQQISSISGVRNLGQILNNPLLRNYVPAQAYEVLNTVDSNGYAGLSSTAKLLRDAGMIYNCLDRSASTRATCQAGLAQPYQHKAVLQDAMRSASGRISQISALMDSINATPDQKSIQEVQARIGAENALLAHELSQIQMLQAMADSEERIARSRERERQYEALSRAGKISDHLR